MASSGKMEIEKFNAGKILRTPPKFINIINGRISMVYRKNGRRSEERRVGKECRL